MHWSRRVGGTLVGVGLVVIAGASVLLSHEGACTVAIDGSEVYSNSNHLSVPGAMLLMPQLVRALESAVAGQ